MADALIGIGADLSSLMDSLKELPDLAGKEADKAIRQIQRMSIKASKGVSKAIRQQARENAKAQKAAERAARAAAREAERQAAEAREAAKGLAELAGVSADRFDKARAVLAGLSSPLGQITVAATGAALAVGGLVVGVVGAGKALVGLTRTAGDLVAELEPLQGALGIAPATVARITAANDALDGVVAVSKDLVVQLADRVAPAVERVAILVVKLGLMAGDALDTMGSGADAVGSVFAQLGSAVVTALAPSLGLLLDMASVTEKIARATGLDGLADGLEDIRTGLRDLPLDIVEVGFEGVEAATRDYDAAAKKLIGTIAQLREEEDKKNKSQRKRDNGADKAAAEAAKAAERALRDYAKALEAARQPFVDRSELAQLQRLQAGLVASAAAAELTDAQVDQLSISLAALSDRIGEIQTASARALMPLQVSLEETAAMADTALQDMGAQVEASFAAIPWGRIWAGSLLETAREAGARAANLIGTLTGGALSALASPIQLLEAATGGASAGKQMAKDAVAFVESLAKNIGPFVRALADALPEIIVALAKAIPKIVVELIKSADDIAIGIVKGITQGLVAYWKTVARLIRNAVRRAFGLDRDRQRGGRGRRFSDTPGPVTSRPGERMTFAAGDRVIAARDDAGLRQQLGDGGRGGPQVVQTVLDVRDGPLRLGIAVATQRAVDRAGVGRDSTGRRRVY